MTTIVTGQRTPFAKFLATLAGLHVVLGLCGVMAACGGAEFEDGIVAGYYKAALKVKKGPPTTGACIECGCEYEHAGTSQGCDVYDCVCSSETDAQCVVDGGPKPTPPADESKVLRPAWPSLPTAPSQVARPTAPRASSTKPSPVSRPGTLQPSRFAR